MNEEEVQNVVSEETAENDEAQPSEEVVEGIELTDTADAEKAEEKVEEQPKGRFMTDEDINDLVDRRVRRKMEKFEKEMSVLRDTSDVVKRAVGGNDINETNKNLRDFYTKEGYDLPERSSGLTERQEEILARGEAEDIIKDGYDAMVEEAQRLANKGYANLNDREKVVFTTISDKIAEENDRKGLLKIGAKDDVLKDAEFIAFKKQFNSNTPIEKIYDLYMKDTKKTTAIENPGSMKNNDVNPVKDYYTPEEISKLTDEQLDDPKIWAAVRKSQTKGYSGNNLE